ncbi:unnamed protein product [Gadus morhua 'NCC']
MHCEPRCGDPLYMQHIRRRASNLLVNKMTISLMHKIATFLSPRFKSLKMLSSDDSLAVHAEVRRRTTDLIPVLQARAEQDVIPHHSHSELDDDRSRCVVGGSGVTFSSQPVNGVNGVSQPLHRHKDNSRTELDWKSNIPVYIQSSKGP